MHEPTMTLAEYAAWADPPITRRTLARLVTNVRPAGRRTGRGRPAALYPVATLAQLHAEWVRSRCADLRDHAA